MAKKGEIPELNYHERALTAAMNAALAVAESEYWFLGLGPEGKPDKKLLQKWKETRPAWLDFILSNPMLPADALWIKAGALGFQDGTYGFFDLPADIQLAFSTFENVFSSVSAHIGAALRRQAEAEALALRQEEERNRPKPENPLEGTGFEQEPDPAGPSDLARDIAAANKWRAEQRAQQEAELKAVAEAEALAKAEAEAKAKLEAELKAMAEAAEKEDVGLRDKPEDDGGAGNPDPDPVAPVAPVET